jgi:hypothetical protein
MATREQLLQALREADAAGDTPAAQAIARRLAGTPQATQVAAPPQNALQQPSEAPQEPSFTRAGARVPVRSGEQDVRDAVRAGIADTAIKGFVGLKQLIPGVGASENDQAVLREMKAESEADPRGFSRGVGNFAGGAAMSANPGTMAAVGPLVKVAGKLGSVAAGAAGSGAAGMLFNPGEGATQIEQLGDKLKQSVKDALAGGAFAGTGKVLRKVFADGMFKPKPEAVKLFDQGVNPTLQQGAEGKTGQFIGGLTSGATNVRARQEKEIEDVFVNRIAGGNLPGGPSRKDNLALIEDAVDAEYRSVLKNKRFYVTKGVQADASAAAAAVMTRTGQFQKASQKAQTEVQEVLGNLPKGAINHATLERDFLFPLAEAAKRTKSERAREGILAARDVVLQKARNARLTPEELAAVEKIDAKRFDVNRFREASQGPGLEKEGITLSKLEGAFSRQKPGESTTSDDLIGPAMRVIGATPTQDQARTLRTSLGRAAGVGIGTGAAGFVSAPVAATMAAVAAPAYGLSLLGQSAKGSRALLGQTEKQKALAEILRRNPKALEAMSTSGYALTTGE